MCNMYSLPVQASQPMSETKEGNGQDCLDDAANQRLIAGLLRALTSDSYNLQSITSLIQMIKVPLL